MKNLFLHNYQFSLLKVIKKKNFWILGSAYILFILLFLVIVPLSLNRSYTLLWNNSLMSGEMFLMYIGALFIAIVAIEIYKTDIDDGTELLLCSKPMTRIKQCFCKLMVFLTIVFTFSIFTILCSSLAYVTHVVNLSDFLWLSLSVYISSVVLFLFFGFIACFASMYLNKVWTCLINVILVTVFSIFSICNSIVIYSPTQQLTNDKNFTISSNRTLGYQGTPGVDGKFVLENSGSIINANYSNYFGTPKISTHEYANNPYAALNNPAIDQHNIYVDIGTKNHQLFNVDDEKNVWRSANERSKNKIANQFDFMQQFTAMNNAFGLEKETAKTSASDFGSRSQTFKYDIENNILDNDEYIPPLFFVSGTGWWGGGYNTYIAQNIANQTIITLGNGSKYEMGIDLSQFTGDSVDSFNIAEGNFKNSRNNSYRKTFNEHQLLPSANEQADFDDIIQTIFDNSVRPNAYLVKSSAATWNGYDVPADASSLDYNWTHLPPPTPSFDASNPWSTWFEYQPIRQNGAITEFTPYSDHIVIHNLYDYIHYLLLKSPHINTIVNGNPNTLLNEVLKFKFYLFYKLIYDTPRFTDQTSTWNIRDINSDILTHPFLFPVDRTGATNPSDSEDMYSMGTIIMPYYNQTSSAADGYSTNFANYYAQHPSGSLAGMFTTNPYFGYTIENGGNLSVARWLLQNYCCAKESHGYEYATLNSTDPVTPADSDYNPAQLSRRYFGSLITSQQNLFIQYERLNFNYTVTPIVNSYYYYLDWVFISIILGIAMFLTYYRKDFK